MEASSVSSSSSVNAGFVPLSSASRAFQGRKNVSFAAFLRSRYLGPPCRSLLLRRARGSRISRVYSSSSSGEDAKKSIRLTIEARTVGNPEAGSNAKLVIEVPDGGAEALPPESVSHVASESAVESPEKVHEEAEETAKPIIASDKHLKEAAKGLQAKADEASEIEAEHLGSSDNKIGQSESLPRESVTQVASESAIESPEKVQEEAEEVAKPVASKIMHPVEEVAEELKEKADKTSEVEAEHLSSLQEGIDLEGIKKGVAEAVQGGVEGAKWGVETAAQSGQRAREGLEVAKEAVQKRAKVLAETAEEAGQKGSQVVEAAKKGLEELRQRMGGVPEGVSRAAEQVQKNVQQVQKNVEQQVTALKRESDDVGKLEKELQKGTEELERGAVENGVPEGGVADRHQAVDSEDVNKDGDEELKKQRREEGGNGEPGVEKAIKEHVDPALSALKPELEEEAEVGDGNEHLKNPKDLMPHDGYAPIQDSRDG